MSIENNINEKVKALAVHIAQKMGELKAKVDQYDELEIAGLEEVRSKTNGIIESLGLVDDGNGNYSYDAETFLNNIPIDAVTNSVAQSLIVGDDDFEVVDIFKTDAEGYLVDAEGNQLLDAENNPTKDPEAVADPSQIVYEQITEDGTVADLLSSVAQNSDLIAANAEAIAANAAAIEDLQEDIATLNTADDYSMLFDVYYETGLSGDITELSSDDVLTNYTNTENNLINITGVENPVIVNLMTASNTLKVTA